MEAFNEFLKRFPHYTPQVFEDIRPFLSVKHIDEGAYFLENGKICREIGFVKKGLLRHYYFNDDREITNCFCKEGGIITSYKSLITQTESDVAIQAVEPSELIVFSYTSLLKLYEKNLFWQQVGRLVLENEYVTAECHNRFLRDLSAADRYKQILEEEPELLQRVPLNYLATYIQVAPETLSRIRRKIFRT